MERKIECDDHDRHTHERAAEQYQELTRWGDADTLYFPIPGGAVDGFGTAVEKVADSIVDQIERIRSDTPIVIPAATIDNEILGNLFRSTTNLEKFEQFLHDLPFELSGQDAPQPMGGDNIAVSGSSAALAAQGGDGGGGAKLKLNIPKRRPTVKVGRNEPCPCGSGKKFKQCCGRQA